MKRNLKTMNNNIKSDDIARVFIAVEITDDVRSSLAEAQKELKKADAHVAWVPPANMHISLAFIGDVFGTHIKTIISELDNIIFPFTLSFDIEKLGTFGRTNHPRVVWAGTSNSGQLEQLQAQIAERLKNTGIFQETRDFKPHLTLGRIRSQRGLQNLMKSIQTLETRHFGHVNVNRIVLMKSSLMPAGAQYSILHTIPLPKDSSSS